MYKRIFDVESKLDEGMFLFGARQTGKSTLLKERFKGAIYYDLLNPRVRKALKLNPNSLWEALQDKPAGTLVIVDEIQKVPDLLDVVHSLMVERGLFFILSGPAPGNSSVQAPTRLEVVRYPKRYILWYGLR